MKIEIFLFLNISNFESPLVAFRWAIVLLEERVHDFHFIVHSENVYEWNNW